MRLILTLLVLNCFNLFAQEPGDFDYVFTSLAAAEENPEIVYSLDLKKNKLKEFPKAVFKFKNLRVLNLSKNKISQIPAQIGGLEKLVELDMSNNKIYSIPPQFKKLKNLQFLLLSRNDIEKIPAEIGELQQLEKLDFWSNNIKEIDDKVYNLKQLKVFDLRGMLFSEEVKKRLVEELSDTEVLYSGGCNCGF